MINITQLAATLGLTSESLRRLRVGRTERRAWSFPMTDAAGRVVGIRLRLPDGRKLSIKGGREGLFIPDGLDHRDQLFVCEGATDTAALLGLGLDAIGRPSCTGGTRHIRDYARRQAVSRVVILADSDSPGQLGGMTLAKELAQIVVECRLIVPPAHVKDARAWVQAGATRDEILAVANHAIPQPRWSAAAVAALRGVGE